MMADCKCLCHTLAGGAAARQRALLSASDDLSVTCPALAVQHAAMTGIMLQVSPLICV